MILGIGADDVFILYDAWLQSAHVEGIKDHEGTAPARLWWWWKGVSRVVTVEMGQWHQWHGY